jgi:hypothetical protein
LCLAVRINSAGQTLNTANNRTNLITEKLQCYSPQPPKCLQRRSSLKVNKANDNQEICDCITQMSHFLRIWPAVLTGKLTLLSVLLYIIGKSDWNPLSESLKSQENTQFKIMWKYNLKLWLISTTQLSRILICYAERQDMLCCHFKIPFTYATCTDRTDRDYCE